MNYADQYYEYDALQRVTKTIVQGAGCSCSGSTGTGTYMYGYAPPQTIPSGSNYNAWLTQTTEMLPDGNQNVVYSNSAGEVMLSAFDNLTDDSINSTLGVTSSPLSGDVWVTYDQYDTQGRLILEAEPSAVNVTTASGLSTLENDAYNANSANPNPSLPNADVVGYNASAGTYQFLNAHSGLVASTSYGGSTTATSTAAGDVLNYLAKDAIQNGTAGTPITQDSAKYFSHTANGSTVYPVASSTVYNDLNNMNETGAETTSDTYTWYTGTNQMQSMVESAPVISTAENGPGTADMTTTVFDIYGRTTWTMDPDGFINYTAYDAGTGSAIESITDVNTTFTSEFASLPAGWATPAGGGLNLITIDQVDGQGRTTKETSPNGNLTYWVYDDPNHEVRTYRGWNPSTGLTTGPIEVTRVDYPNNYTETFTMVTTPYTNGSLGNLIPNGTEPISGVQTLDRALGDNTGREIEDDSYFSLGTISYSTSPQLGMLNTNYYATYYGYDTMGRQSRIVDAVGTITDTLYDSLGRVAYTLVGTGDTYSPGGLYGASNMVMTSADQYDGNGVGDGNLTQDTAYAHSIHTPDTVTLSAYDFRDRLVATKSGDQLSGGSEDTSTKRPLVFDTLDNLGEVTSESIYVGDGVSLSAFVASPTSYASDLRGSSTTAYDDQGRAYQEKTYKVDQSSGAVTTNALTTRIFYDHRGDVIATYAPGGTTTKNQYDGAGRLVSNAITDGFGGSNLPNGITWTNAVTLSGDNVLTQSVTTYDLDGNPTQVTTAARNHNSTDTGALLVTPQPTTPSTVQFVDDSSPTGFTTTAAPNGTNFSHTGGNGFDGTYAYINGVSGASATWTFQVVPGMVYSVASTWSAYSGDAASETYTIASGSNNQTATVNQQNAPVGFLDQGWTWQQLGGTITASGTTLTVTLPSSATGFVEADAIRLQQVSPDQFVDDSSPTGFTTTAAPNGTNFSHTGGNGFDGTYAYINGVSGASATWTFQVVPGMVYSVASTWSAYSGDAASETYTIASGSNNQTATVNQQNAPVGFLDQGWTWQQLGGTITASGTTLTVTLPSSATGFVEADAIRLHPFSMTQAAVVPVVSASPSQFIDDSSPMVFTTTAAPNGTNFSHTGGNGFDGTYDYINGVSGASATWTFQVIPGTVYSVSSTWSAYAGNAASETYTIASGSNNQTATVNQQNAPVGFLDQGWTWQQLGGTITASGTTLTVILPSSATGFVEADAIRLQSVDSRISYSSAYYDAADRPIASVDYGTNGGVSFIRPPSAPTASTDIALLTTMSYNPAGWVSLVSDPLNILTETQYDMLGRATQVIAAYNFPGPTPPSSTPAPSYNQTTNYTYDGLDHTTSVTAMMPSGSTPSQTTTYTYGVTGGSGGNAIYSNDLLASITQPGLGPTNAAEVESSTYDAQGDILTRTDPNNTVHTYTYDVLGRQISDAVTTLGAGVDGSIQLLTTGYDAEGNANLFTSYSSTAGGVSNIVNQVLDVYNGLGQLTAEYQEQAGAVNTSTSAEVQYAYTEMAGGQNNSRLTSMTYPNGRVLDFVYNSGLDNAISRVSAIADDNAGSPGTVLESYAYLGLGMIVAWSHPQTGVNLTYIRQPGDTAANTTGGDQYTGLDRFGRVIDQNWVNTTTGSADVRYQYGYNRNGEVLYRADLVHTALSELYQASGAQAGVAYDPLGRLTSFSRGTLGSGNTTITSPSYTQSFSLDALGNQLGVTTNGTTVTQAYNSLNEQTGTGAASTYDADGNTKTQAGLSYVYDAWNRLVTVKNTGGTTIAGYSYDAMGDRITETYATGTTDHLYYGAGGGVIEERQGSTAASATSYQYVWGASGNLVLRDTVASGSVVAASRLYALQDANGDTTALVNTSGTVVERFEYSPYGVVTVLNEPGTPVADGYAWRYLFQGGRLDTATGLYLFGARDYNPAQGTWMERDPLGLGGGDLNEHRFVGNDPIASTDNTGLFDDKTTSEVLGNWISYIMNPVSYDVQEFHKNHPDVVSVLRKNPSFNEEAVWRAAIVYKQIEEWEATGNFLAAELAKYYLSDRSSPLTLSVRAQKELIDHLFNHFKDIWDASLKYKKGDCTISQYNNRIRFLEHSLRGRVDGLLKEELVRVYDNNLFNAIAGASLGMSGYYTKNNNRAYFLFTIKDTYSFPSYLFRNINSLAYRSFSYLESNKFVQPFDWSFQFEAHMSANWSIGNWFRMRYPVVNP